MKLSNILNNKNIILPIKSDNTTNAIQELLNRLLDLNYLTGTIKLHKFIDNKNKLINSAVGRGIAYHYSTSLEIKEQLAVLGLSHDGIDYNSPDGQKVHFVLLILDTQNESNLHRKLITRFQHFIKDSNLKTQAMDCKKVQEILDLILDWEENYLLNEEI